MSDKTLENYLFIMGELAIYLQLYTQDQDEIIRTGALNDDEGEIAVTIQYRIEQLMQSMGDQVKMVGDRIPLTWEEVMKNLKERLNEKN